MTARPILPTADWSRDRGEQHSLYRAQRNPPAHIPHDCGDGTPMKCGRHSTASAGRRKPDRGYRGSVRERGVGALKETGGKSSGLSRCDAVAAVTNQSADRSDDERKVAVMNGGRIPTIT